MCESIRLRLGVVFLMLPAAVIAADLEKGLEAYNVGDYETSLAECQPLAEEGNAMAQFCVGRLYANGFGVPMDDALALKWYGLAAEQGHAESQYNLGVMHANGWGVPMSDEEAAKWYRSAAEGGNVEAQSALANICYNGRGTEENAVDALMWYTVAASLGDTNARFKLDTLADELSPEQVAEAKGLARSKIDEMGVDAFDDQFLE